MANSAQITNPKARLRAWLEPMGGSAEFIPR